jgi:hypothetical protein
MARDAAGGPAPIEPVAGLGWWRAGVLALPVALSAVELGRIGLFGTARNLLTATVVTAIVLPPHLSHVGPGLSRSPVEPSRQTAAAETSRREGLVHQVDLGGCERVGLRVHGVGVLSAAPGPLRPRTT